MNLRSTVTDRNGYPRSAVAPPVIATKSTLSEGLAAKMSAPDALQLLSKTATAQRRLVLRLFERPITSRTALSFFGYPSAHASVFYDTNRSFAAAGVQDAILRIPLWQRSKDVETTLGFWILALNPRTFDVPERVVLVPGEDVRYLDVMQPRFAKIWNYLRVNQFLSTSELESMFGANTVVRFRTDCNQRHVHPMVDLALPDPILKTDTMPELYRTNPAFEALYCGKAPAPVSRPRPLRELLDPSDISLLLKLAGYAIVTLSVLAPDKCTSNTYRKLMKLNKRCKELGLPKAVLELKPKGSEKRFKVNPKFRERYQLPNPEHKSLNVHFTPREKELLLYVAEKPMCGTMEIGVHLGISYNAVCILLKSIARKCNADKLPKPVLYGRNPYRIYLPESFTSAFGIPYVWVKKIKFAIGKREVEVCTYMEAHDRATKRQVADALGLSYSSVNCAVARVNRRLRGQGFLTY